MKQCYYLIYSPVLQYSLSTIEKKKNVIQLKRQCVMQILPVILQMHKDGYTHNDIHPGNIMFFKHWYLIDYGLIRHKSWKKNKQDIREYKSHKSNDIMSLINLSIHSPIKHAGFVENKFKVPKFKTVMRSIKKSSCYPELKLMVKNIKTKWKDDFIEKYCELYYFDIFRKAFGAPDTMILTPSKLCISEKMLKKMIALL